MRRHLVYILEKFTLTSMPFSFSSSSIVIGGMLFVVGWFCVGDSLLKMVGNPNDFNVI